MTSVSYSPSLVLMHLNFSAHCRFRRTLAPSAVRRRHHRRRLLKFSPTPSSTSAPSPPIFKLSDDALQITLKPPSHTLQRLETRLNQFIDYGRDAIDDLKTVVTVDSDTGGLVISCKRSTVELLAALLVSSLVVIFAFRVLFRLGKSGGEVLIYKRDRSLGGKEVVVGKREASRPTSRKSTPLSLDSAEYYYQNNRNRMTSSVKRKEKLPQWWPQVVNLGPQEIDNKEEYQRMANIFIREIMDRKMNGQDISTNDIVELRHFCKTYSVRATINTANARDSLYRTSINFVLSYCEGISNLSCSIQINGEDAQEFIAGLADNIGLESAHAARMVSAAVAARTRSRILQAWALDVQNKRSEALAELFKVCLIHHIFPPEDGSPEMEMVAQSLGKPLSLEQRRSILELFTIVSGEEIPRSVVEALGLVGVQDELADQQL